jgi:peptide-methionine (S)-S-oxide reductase
MNRSHFSHSTRRTVLLAIAFSCCLQAQTRGRMPAPQTDAALASKPGKETAIFAGGCFWGTQSVFERVRGVVATTAGYSGVLRRQPPTIK